MAPKPENQSTGASGDSLKAVETLAWNQVQVDDKVYDAQALSAIHPGGELFVKVFAGRDATEAFLSYHRRNFPHEKMSSVLVGKTSNFKDKSADQDYLELCERVDKVLPRHKTFAPFYYYLKLVGLMISAVGLEYYQHSTNTYRWYLSVLQGLLFAWVGMNIQHDANHGAISRNAWVNRILGMSQNWIGGSALDWIHQHVVQHHIYPNDVENDPDIVGNDILRLNPAKPLTAIQGMQHLYVFVLFAFFGLSYVISTFQHLWQGFHYTKMSALVKGNRTFDECTVLFFFFRWFGIPLYQEFSLNRLLTILPVFVAGGYYLAFFFIISHNFEGATLNHQQYTLHEDKSFLRRQVLTAANVGGPVLAFINGGLNYQIEHHLFPRIQHSHYPLIAPVVKKFCEEKGVTYRHFPTVGENVMSCVRHLYLMGHQKTPPGFHDNPKKQK
jgi:acyl-lipid (7-3)-desaturase (Delta-4 desaturase)